MNPCPCGFAYDPHKECTCKDSEIRSYTSKISGPLLDRIDIHVRVDPVDCEELIKAEKNHSSSPREHSSQIRARVLAARKVQQNRFRGTDTPCNAYMSPSQVRTHCTMSAGAENILIGAFKKLNFSARSNDKILKVACTIADLDRSDIIEVKHISEAVQYRSLDRL